MKQLVQAVADSIVAEVADASLWHVEIYDPMWRNPQKGQVLNVYADTRSRAEPQWTDHEMDHVDVMVEYGEPASEQATRLDRDEVAELAAEDVADSLRTWALSHEAGFTPAWRMDWLRTRYVPSNNRQLFVRYCRMELRFWVVVSRV